MHFITWPTVRLMFKISCLASLILLSVYWIYKFVIEDEDLCLVDYKTVEKTDTFPLPMVSVCFGNPFLHNKLEEISPNIIRNNSSVKSSPRESVTSYCHQLSHHVLRKLRAICPGLDSRLEVKKLSAAADRKHHERSSGPVKDGE